MSAAGYAAHRSSFTPDDWWRMEAAAFRGEHAVRDALALTAPRHLALTLRGERSGASAWQRILAVPFLLWTLGSLALTAIWGLPVLLWSIALREDGLAVGTFGVIALVSALCGLALLIQELRLRTLDRGLVTVTVVRLVPAALGVLGALLWLGAGAPVDDSLERLVPVTAWWVVPMVADLVISIALLVLALRGGQAPSAGRQARADERLATAIAALPEPRRSEIARDLGAAIDTLEHAGAIDAGTAARARATPLGELASTMSPVTAAG